MAFDVHPAARQPSETRQQWADRLLWSWQREREHVARRLPANPRAAEARRIHASLEAPE